jgi:hypothetical protein
MLAEFQLKLEYQDTYSEIFYKISSFIFTLLLHKKILSSGFFR